MKITGSKWGPTANILFIKCNCGNTITHPVNKWVVKCPKCTRIGNLQDLREEYAKGAEDENGI